MRRWIALPVVVLLGLCGVQPAEAHGCPRLRVPGTEHQVVACLDDLTTAGTVASGHTNPADYAGLTAADMPQQSGVRGVQIDGYFPDTSKTNTNHGWNHDAQYVIRLPKKWNGGLVVAGSPGVRAQYANDKAISDWVLAHGYAFAATDKGNTGANFFTDGTKPGDAIVEWNHRTTQLTRAARAVVNQYYGRPAREVVAAGISNGGYLVRWQLENHPELYTRGVDLEGTLWTADGPNLFTFLPPAIKGYEQQRPEAIINAGFDRHSDFLWDYHYAVYWKLTQRIYAAELDPTYTGAEADYDYCPAPGRTASRPTDRADREDQPPADHLPRHPRQPAADHPGLGRLRRDGQASWARHACTRTSGSRQAIMSTVSSTPTPTGWYPSFPFCRRRSRARTPS